MALGAVDTRQLVEGNYYFPPRGVTCEYQCPSGKCMTCFRKRVAKYFDDYIDGVSE